MFITPDGTISANQAININNCLSFNLFYDEYDLDMLSKTGILFNSFSERVLNLCKNELPYTIVFKMNNNTKEVWQFKTEEEANKAYMNVLMYG